MMTKVRSGVGAIFVLGMLIAVISGGQCQGDDVLLLQGGQPRIEFDDTLGIQKWTVYGDSTGFGIHNVSTDHTPFRIQTGAPRNSLFIAFDGLVGLGTEAPEQHLHVFSSANPTMRFEQDNAEFAAYTWDVGGNEGNFYVQDVTGGNTLPFIIRPGAPTSSLEIASSGNVGFGTSSPTAPIHVKKSAQAVTAEVLARFAVADDSTGSLVISNSSAGDGVFIPKITARSASQNAALINEALITNDVGGSPAIAYNAALGAGGPLVTRPLVVYRNNSVAKVTIAANGVVTATSFNPVSSRALKHDIKDLDSQKASDALRQLTPVQFVYNDDESAEERVGFIAEDVPEIVANADRQSVPIMDVVALVTRVVKDQQQTIDEQRKVNDEQKKTIDLLMKRLEALESQAKN
jgi:hypothetical protein